MLAQEDSYSGELQLKGPNLFQCFFIYFLHNYTISFQAKRGKVMILDSLFLFLYLNSLQFKCFNNKSGVWFFHVFLFTKYNICKGRHKQNMIMFIVSSYFQLTFKLLVHHRN